MAGDIFDNLRKGLSDLIPEDDPFIKPLQLQGEIKKLREKEDEVYKEVGRKALEFDGEIRYRDELGRLLEIRRKRQAIQERLYKIQAEKNARKGSMGWPGTQNAEETGQSAKQDGKRDGKQEMNQDSNWETNQGQNRETNQGSNQGTNQGPSQEMNQGSNREMNQGTNREMNQGSNRETNQDSNRKTGEPDTMRPVICSECGCGNPPENQFCRECGAKLDVNTTKKCPSCGNEMDVDSKFCGRCGQKM